MEKNAFDVLRERGFVEQCNHEAELYELLSNEKITFYIGYDPTADSLTAGHFLTLMALAHLQRAGHRPIIVMGGGTGMVGDPTDRTEMRKVMPKEEIDRIVECLKTQFAKFIDFEDGRALMLNNADWLMKLEYIPFIREYGVHFSVNRMLSAEAYKSRLDIGLTFFEFNYMLMQAFDYLTLYRRYNCRLQLGGNDQWSNILAGTELIRKAENADTYVLTLSLLTTSDGTKMGKSMGGAVWLDAERTTPYEFFQYWRNVDDGTVIRNLKLLTFLPVEEIDRMSGWTGSELNAAKEILAYQVTRTVHGEPEAEKALSASKALFNSGAGDDSSMPTTLFDKTEFDGGMNIIVLLERTGLISSRSEGRRLIDQRGIKLNDRSIGNFDCTVTPNDFENDNLVIQKGKKVFHRVTLV